MALLKAKSYRWLLLLVTVWSSPIQAQMPDWARQAFGDFTDRWDRDASPPAPTTPRTMPRTAPHSAGARPDIAPITPAIVPFPYQYAANSIVIDTSYRKLYYVLTGERAYVYPVAVGREGFGWTGSERVTKKQSWPDWIPPKEMRERDPSLPERMSGGLGNPLGAAALYLGNTLYRIHGTNDAKSIGRAESSGCFRMLNGAVVHLASLADVGTEVIVVTSLQRNPETRPSDHIMARAKPTIESEPTTSSRISSYRE